ncbi:MAG: SpoVA/SpoVAEb family sporulation membrane protein, partial [Oscillospiraceae bacterium]|nr:SpoVA/SpoVAEb family sporulation membrane protein [Oscillospiraceae bacterium]
MTGGLICAVGQGIFSLCIGYSVSEDNARTIVSLVLIALTAILTVLGVFDRIAKHAGAGTFVPITGFANS